MKLLLKISILTILLTLSSVSFAQVQTPIDGVTIDTDISNPRPGQIIEVFIESYSFDLNASSIVWIVDGKTYNQGIGMKSIDIVAPKLGVKMTVNAVIKGSDGREVQKSMSVKTASVDIIWESYGYTHPFYEGKIPFVYQNSVKLTAIPHIAKNSTEEIDPKTLVYSWKRGGKYIDGGQGYGKQSVIIPADDLPKNVEITVDITNREQTQYTMGSMTLVPAEPSISFYEEDSLYGILYNKALSGDVTLKNTEMKILSVPFGFNLTDRDITYAWMINTIEQSNLMKNRSITIRTKGDVEGKSNIDLDIRNQDDILQGARNSFSISFSKKNNIDEPITF